MEMAVVVAVFSLFFDNGRVEFWLCGALDVELQRFRSYNRPSEDTNNFAANHHQYFACKILCINPFRTDKYWEADMLMTGACSHAVYFVQGPIIVGGGPSGLATAACLRHRGIPSLILEKSDSIASLWKYRTYDRIHLHLPKQFCELPLFSISEAYPDFLTAAQYVTYLENYAHKFQLSVRFNENVISATYDESSGFWKVCTVNCKRGNFNVNENYSSRWLVVASGENAQPAIPEIADLAEFRGNMLHSSNYKNGVALSGCRVLVVGCGNSGMEIAFDLAYSGAKPSIVVRGFVHVLPIEMFGTQTYTIIAKLLKIFPVWLADKLLILGAWCTLRSTSKYGLKRPKEGPLSMKNRLGKTPVLDVGTYSLIKKGQIKVRPAVERFTGNGVTFFDGQSEEFDAVVLATGYKSNIPEWLFSENDFFTPDGLPKSRNIHSWKGKRGLYTVGLSGKGIPGICFDSQRIAEDIQANFQPDEVDRPSTKKMSGCSNRVLMQSCSHHSCLKSYKNKTHIHGASHK